MSNMQIIVEWFKNSSQKIVKWVQITKWLKLCVNPELQIVIVLMYFIPWLMNYAWTILSTPFQAEFREGAMLVITDFFLHGKNPLSLANHPLTTDNYGFLYNLLVLPLAYWLGNTLFIHRLVSIVFCFLSSVLIIIALRRIKVSFPFAIAGGGILFASLLFFVTPLARPDSLGEFVFLAAILYPWFWKFDNKGLIVSSGLGVATFFVKAQFLLAVGIVAVYLFLFISWRKSILYMAITTGLLLIAVVGLHIMIPLDTNSFFLDTVIGNVSNFGGGFSYMVLQLFLFALIFAPCIILMLFPAELNIKITISSLGNNWRIVLHNFWRKLSLDNSFIYFVLYFLCALMVLVMFFGHHMGAFLTYFFQLLTPALILITFYRLQAVPHLKRLSIPLIVVNFFILCFLVLYPNQLSSAQLANWQELNQYVDSSENVLNSPVFVSELVASQRLPIDSGQSEYFYAIKPFPDLILSPNFAAVQARRQLYFDSIQRAIQKGEYDWIIVTKYYNSPLYDRKSLGMYYVHMKDLEVAMPQTRQLWALEIWKPK